MGHTNAYQRILWGKQMAALSSIVSIFFIIRTIQMSTQEQFIPFASFSDQILYRVIYNTTPGYS